MFRSVRSLRSEFRPMRALAAPVILAELGWVTMGMVDTLMVGRLGPEAIGAVGMGSTLFLAVGVFAMGLMLGLDTLVSQAFGAGRLEDCRRWLVHGVALAAALTPVITAALLVLNASLSLWGIHPAVQVLTERYLSVLAWSVLPLLLYACFRRYLQGVGAGAPVMTALILANLVNVAVNWILIFGHLGAPALGVAGAAWATVCARIVMAAYLLIAILWIEGARRGARRQAPSGMRMRLRIEAASMRRLLALGIPAAAQFTLEVGIFAAVTALAARFPPAALAAHQIALNIVAFTYMVPLGVSAAGAVRVGHAIGRSDGAAAARAGWTAVLFGVGFMSAAAVAFVLVPRVLIGAFTVDEAALEIGVGLLAVAAVFQLFDGLQVVATGVLRGMGDTRTPMYWNLAGHWAIGLPVAWALAFWLGWGVVGLWWGLSAGLITCGAALLGVWSRRARSVLPLLHQRGGGIMAEPNEQNEPPRPHGDPLEREIVEENQAQRQSDAPADAVAGERPEELIHANTAANDRWGGRGSDANGIPAFDEDDGARRRAQYEGGAELVSKID